MTVSKRTACLRFCHADTKLANVFARVMIISTAARLKEKDPMLNPSIRACRRSHGRVERLAMDGPLVSRYLTLPCRCSGSLFSSESTETVRRVGRAGGSPHAENRDRGGVMAASGFAVRSMARLADGGDSPDRRR